MGKRQQARKERRNRKRGPKFVASGLVRKVVVPDEEKVLIKTVPANVDMEDGNPKVEVGQALLYDDGSVDIIISPNADPAAVAMIKGAEQTFGYTMGTGD